jgi:hypothetical protein
VFEERSGAFVLECKIFSMRGVCCVYGRHESLADSLCIRLKLYGVVVVAIGVLDDNGIFQREDDRLKVYGFVSMIALTCADSSIIDAF